VDGRFQWKAHPIDLIAFLIRLLDPERIILGRLPPRPFCPYFGGVGYLLIRLMDRHFGVIAEPNDEPGVTDHTIRTSDKSSQ